MCRVVVNMENGHLGRHRAMKFRAKILNLVFALKIAFFAEASKIKILFHTKLYIVGSGHFFDPLEDQK